MCDQIQCRYDCNGCFDEAFMMACEMRVTVRVESRQRLLFDVWLISQCFPFTELETIVSSIYQKEKRMEGGQRGKDFSWNDWFFNVQNTRREDDIRWMEWGKGLLFKRLICFLSVKLTASVNRSVGNDTSCIYEKKRTHRRGLLLDTHWSIFVCFQDEPTHWISAAVVGHSDAFYSSSKTASQTNQCWTFPNWKIKIQVLLG